MIKSLTSKEKSKDKRLYKTYGITLAEWTELYRAQGQVCDICKTMPRSGILSVDHRHVPGFKTLAPCDKKLEVRGLLCFLCNTGLRNLEKTKDGKTNRQRLEGTYEYFKKYKLKGE